MFWFIKYLLLCSHIEFEDSEEEAGDTVVTGGLKIGQARSFSLYDIDEIFKCCKVNWKLILIYSQTEQAGADQLGGQKANTRMPTDGLTNSISRFFFNSTSYDLYNCGFEISIFIMDTSPQFLEKDRPLLRRLQTGAVETPDNYSYHGLACIFSNCHSGCAWTWNVNKSRNLWNRQCVSLRIKVHLYIGYTRSVLWCL